VRARLNLLLLVVAYGYLVSLFGWYTLHLLAGDRWWWLFLLNAFSAYLFIPLLLLPPLILVVRQHRLWMSTGAAALLWLHLYGALVLPTPTVQAEANGPALRVMTYNLLRHNMAPGGIIASIREADADVVALQELNIPVSRAIVAELGDEYPYRVIDARMDKHGMGVISRYPLRDTGEHLPGSLWFGVPRLLELNFQGTPVLLLNIHAISTSVGHGGDIDIAPARMEWSIRQREQQMRLLAGLAARHEGPLIIAGDFNTGDQNHAYDIVSRQLNDAWRAAGTGLGYTFPGAAGPGSSRPSIAGIRSPKWLIRIDYIFSSAHWDTTEASIGPWYGRSDHRPVVARLVLREPDESS
jgi:endonuclease/exonuclease/phosphatase (EEP) superfamily protein YafD